MSRNSLAGTGSWWGDRSVRTKVLATVGVAGVVAASIGVLGLGALSRSADSGDALYRENVSGLVAVAVMGDTVRDMRVNLRDTLVGTDVPGSISNIDTLADRFSEATDDYAAGGLVPAKQELVDDVRMRMGEWVDLQQTVLVPLATARDYPNWIATNAAQAAPLSTAVMDDVAQLRDLEADEAQRAVAAIRSEYESQRTTAIVLMIAGIAVALGLGWFVASGIARSAGRVREVVQGLAEGDLTRSSGLTGNDELGQMGQALDGAMASLRGVMGLVVASSDAVAAASEELSASSAQISVSAEETSAQSGVVSAAAEEVSRNVATVAAGADEMSSAIREISQSVNEATRVAAQAVAEAQTTTGTIEKLGVSSQEIGAVVKTITSIAEQT
ncbi:methyl-accepting chemotaxis protein, partial [Modestobacter roseus]